MFLKLLILNLNVQCVLYFFIIKYTYFCLDHIFWVSLSHHASDLLLSHRQCHPPHLIVWCITSNFVHKYTFSCLNPTSSHKNWEMQELGIFLPSRGLPKTGHTTLAGKVANMSATCRPDSQMSALLADIPLSWRHKTNPDTVFMCRGLPTFTQFVF